MLLEDSRLGFASDNCGVAPPQILNRWAQLGYAPAYGADQSTALWNEFVVKTFGLRAQSFFCFNGTAANVLGLSQVLKSFEMVIASDVAHVQVDECGALENFSGSRVWTVPHALGKVSVAGLNALSLGHGEPHSGRARVLSLTQPTELGTFYTNQELLDLCAWARNHNCLVHMDGARFANACVASKQNLFDGSFALGVDILSLGGTKLGLPFGEAVIFADQARAVDFGYLRKQGLNLASKMQYVSSAFLELYATPLWTSLASMTLAQASRVADAVGAMKNIEVVYPVESNAVFVAFNRKFQTVFEQHVHAYVWEQHGSRLVYRLMMPPMCPDVNVDRLIDVLHAL